MSITSQSVISVLVKAGIKRWMLLDMRLYDVDSRQTPTADDVEILVALSERLAAVSAIRATWPNLLIKNYSEIARFCDPTVIGVDGLPRRAIDLVFSFFRYQCDVLEYGVRDAHDDRGHIPALEAVLVLNYAKMISFFSEPDEKDSAARDFRRIARVNHHQIDRTLLRRLAAQVWEDAAEEIERFWQIALSEKPFVR